ncbi:MAG: sulfite exporter TauE/SafE family protein [Rhodocyclaceae bacterium]|nr:sulfite exporter TauE/SafE family protein [Rhodocyclaceae bacterium]
MFGTASAAVRYARRIDVPWRAALPAAIAAFILSYFGAMAVSLMPREWLLPACLVLLIAVTAYTYARKESGAVDRAVSWQEGHVSGGRVWWGNPGFTMVSLGRSTWKFSDIHVCPFFRLDFLRASVSAKIVNAATNLAALLYFGASAHVLLATDWPWAAFNVSGSLGRLAPAIRHGAGFVRRVFLVVAGVLIMKFGWDTFY